jgi:hypothetical protein
MLRLFGTVLAAILIVVLFVSLGASPGWIGAGIIISLLLVWLGAAFRLAAKVLVGFIIIGILIRFMSWLHRDIWPVVFFGLKLLAVLILVWIICWVLYTLVRLVLRGSSAALPLVRATAVGEFFGMNEWAAWAGQVAHATPSHLGRSLIHLPKAIWFWFTWRQLLRDLQIAQPVRPAKHYGDHEKQLLRRNVPALILPTPYGMVIYFRPRAGMPRAKFTDDGNRRSIADHVGAYIAQVTFSDNGAGRIRIYMRNPGDRVLQEV